jgi:hypothetical protein
MPRKDKNTVDYFPHDVNHGKTMFILESKFGLEGYAAWFKILENLGKSENHYIDCRDDTDWEFMQAKIGLMHTSLQEILDLLAKLNAIHPELWSKRIIWSGNFIKNIQAVYDRRKRKCMNFHDLCKHLSIKCKHEYDINGNNVDRSTHSRVEESRVEKSIYDDLNSKYSKAIDKMDELQKLDIVKEKYNDVGFLIFWDEYHYITGLNKTDKEAALKYWKSLNKKEQRTAVLNIQNYYDNLNDKKYCKKARTYLSDKNFNDEFKEIKLFKKLAR